MRKKLNKILEPTGYRITKFRVETPPPHPAPFAVFHSDYYLRHNARRLEHLATLQLPLANKTVLEVGAGPGDHTHFFLDRGCQVTATEPRPENLALLKERYPNITVRELDLEKPQMAADEKFDIVHCYGLLYHLSDPAVAIKFMAEHCKGLLLLETCVSFGSDLQTHIVDEDPEEPSQSRSGKGCRPTRPWIFAEMRKHIPFVYVTRTQPCHDQFPIDWAGPVQPGLVRSVFIGSFEKLSNPMLLDHVPDKQTRT